MKAIKVVIDARMVGAIPHGIARYVVSIARGLQFLGPLPYRPLFLVGPSTPPGLFEPFETQRVRASFLSFQEWLEIPFWLRTHQASLYHSPSFASLPYCPCPHVLTLHDLNHLTYGSRVQKFYYQKIVKPFAQKALQVMTVSDFSKKELANWLVCEPSFLSVVSNTLSPPVLGDPLQVQERLSRWKLKPKRYFLCLSNPKPHKNLPLLLRAYHQARLKVGETLFPLLLPDFKIQASDPEWLHLKATPGVLTLDPKFCELLQDPVVFDLIQHAAALFFPSLYEGFGLPPVEAASQGVPLVVSSIPPHREALRDLLEDEVQWVDPRDWEAWAKAFERISRAVPQGPREESQKKLRDRFSVRAMGERIHQIYQTALLQNGVRPSK